VAQEVAGAAKVAGAGKTFVDANAISPDRARAIAATIDAAGMRYVDGGIIGGPPTRRRPTAIYLSGPGGDDLVDALTTREIRVTWLGPEPAAASAIKMAYAAWTKGTNALALAVRSLARAEGVEDALLAEWQRSQPSALDWSNRAPATAGKAWRWVAEMEEIAASLDGANVPSGAFAAAADIYARLEAYKDAHQPPPLDEMIDRILGPAGFHGV
jgi:3-hydroxyisobutyrate dehydrogenase-like beta-hydroxyacid dehydrogenase